MVQQIALTPAAKTTADSKVLGAAINVDRLVEPELFAESRRCLRITNRYSGEEWMRKLDENAKWETLYKYCKKNPQVFDLHMAVEEEEVNEEGPLLDKHGVPIFTESELLGRNIQQLREIGKAYDLTGRSKSQLIVDIMKAQRRG